MILNGISQCRDRNVLKTNKRFLPKARNNEFLPMKETFFDF